MLHYTEENAGAILTSPEFLTLSERMIHVISERELQMDEIDKVKAILSWGEKNFNDGENCVVLIFNHDVHVMGCPLPSTVNQ